MADLATERERQLTTARANQATGLSKGKAANWASEVAFSSFRGLSCRQLTRFSGLIPTAGTNKMTNAREMPGGMSTLGIG